MEIRTAKEGTATIVTVAGKLDAVTAPEYEKAISALIQSGDIRLIMDFAELGYISSAGLRVILAAAKQIKARDGRLAFANLSGNVREVFDISGFGGIFALHGSVSDALAGLG